MKARDDRQKKNDRSRTDNNRRKTYADRSGDGYAAPPVLPARPAVSVDVVRQKAEAKQEAEDQVGNRSRGHDRLRDYCGVAGRSSSFFTENMVRKAKTRKARPRGQNVAMK